ncbi:putative aldehyde dehydrogenase [Platanthera zijinensis]|uniref:Aldehyde dehydrogenase n=1 Tax=Platanthera zijinensis TaxID=2320716 RepID=A0AAP0C380_9ASPA
MMTVETLSCSGVWWRSKYCSALAIHPIGSTPTTVWRSKARVGRPGGGGVAVSPMCRPEEGCAGGRARGSAGGRGGRRLERIQLGMKGEDGGVHGGDKGLLGFDAAEGFVGSVFLLNIHEGTRVGGHDTEREKNSGGAGMVAAAGHRRKPARACDAAAWRGRPSACRRTTCRRTFEMVGDGSLVAGGGGEGRSDHFDADPGEGGGAKPHMTLFTGSSRVAEKLAGDLRGRVKLEDAGFDWKILGPDVQEVDYVAWVCDQDAYACSGQKCSAQRLSSSVCTRVPINIKGRLGPAKVPWSKSTEATTDFCGISAGFLQESRGRQNPVTCSRLRIAHLHDYTDQPAQMGQ